MLYNLGKDIVIGLGGSSVFPDDINVLFLKRFKNFLNLVIKKHKDKRFFIVVGGGNLARKFQKSLNKIQITYQKEKDMVGIYATRLNTLFVKSIFKDKAYKKIVEKEEDLNNVPKKEKLVFISGWEPGCSTDFVTSFVAYKLKSKEYILAGKPAFVYNKNPDRFKNAKPFYNLTWKEYGKILPNLKWKAGSNIPVDPVAFRFSRKNKLKAIVIKAENLKNFDNLIAGKDFAGTIIS